MLEPVKLADFFIVFFSAASVILFGASYALLFAWSRVKTRPRLMMLAYAAYAGLVFSVITLALAANLFHNTFWSVIVFLMLAGYLLAPHAIWQLCVGTHAEEHDALTPNPSDGTTSHSTRQAKIASQVAGYPASGRG